MKVFVACLWRAPPLVVWFSFYGIISICAALKLEWLSQLRAQCAPFTNAQKSTSYRAFGCVCLLKTIFSKASRAIEDANERVSLWIEIFQFQSSRCESNLLSYCLCLCLSLYPFHGIISGLYLFFIYLFAMNFWFCFRYFSFTCN